MVSCFRKVKKTLKRTYEAIFTPRKHEKVILDRPHLNCLKNELKKIIEKENPYSQILNIKKNTSEPEKGLTKKRYEVIIETSDGKYLVNGSILMPYWLNRKYFSGNKELMFDEIQFFKEKGSGIEEIIANEQINDTLHDATIKYIKEKITIPKKDTDDSILILKGGTIDLTNFVDNKKPEVNKEKTDKVDTIIPPHTDATKYN